MAWRTAKHYDGRSEWTLDHLVGNCGIRIRVYTHRSERHFTTWRWMAYPILAPHTLPMIGGEYQDLEEARLQAVRNLKKALLDPDAPEHREVFDQWRKQSRTFSMWYHNYLATKPKPMSVWDRANEDD